MAVSKRSPPAARQTLSRISARLASIQAPSRGAVFALGTAATTLAGICYKLPAYLQVTVARRVLLAEGRHESRAAMFDIIEQSRKPWTQLDTTFPQDRTTVVVFYGGNTMGSASGLHQLYVKLGAGNAYHVFVPQAGFAIDQDAHALAASWTKTTDEISTKLAKAILQKRDVKKVICIGYSLGSLGSSYFIRNLVALHAQESITVQYVSYNGLNSFLEAADSLVTAKMSPLLAKAIQGGCYVVRRMQDSIISNLKEAIASTKSKRSCCCVKLSIGVIANTNCDLIRDADKKLVTWIEAKKREQAEQRGQPLLLEDEDLESGTSIHFYSNTFANPINQPNKKIFPHIPRGHRLSEKSCTSIADMITQMSTLELKTNRLPEKDNPQQGRYGPREHDTSAAT